MREPFFLLSGAKLAEKERFAMTGNRYFSFCWLFFGSFGSLTVSFTVVPN